MSFLNHVRPGGHMRNVRLVLASVLLVLVGILVPALTASGATPDGPVRLELVGQVSDKLPNGNLGDMSFWGDRMVVGFGTTEPRGGFALVDIADPTNPQVLSRVDCAGAHNDVTLYGDLVLVSVDGMEHGGPARCGGDGPVSGGLRIFSVADPRKPVEVRPMIATCHGAHTHTAVPDLDHTAPDGSADPRLLVYLTNKACAKGSALPGASVQVVEVPLLHPKDAGLVPSAITIEGGTEDGCHDITVLAPRALALAACGLQRAELWDVSVPEDPRRLSYVDAATPPDEQPHPSNVTMNHSAAFSLDGKVLAIGEESGGGAVNACNLVHDRRGEIRFYDVSDPARPVYRSAYKIPRLVPQAQACTAHYFSPVHTVDGRRLFVSGWYGGGVTLIDATDPAKPTELAHHVELGSNVYAAYEYNGYVYVSNGELATVPTVAAGGGSRRIEVLRLHGIKTRTLDQLDPQVQKVMSGRPFRAD